MLKSIQKLIKKRIGYKYLYKSWDKSIGISPYQNYDYDLSEIPGKILETKLNNYIFEDCGCGWNIATLNWIKYDYHGLFKNIVIVECLIPEDARICVPANSDGKFRTDKIQIIGVYQGKNIFHIWIKIKYKTMIRSLLNLLKI